MSYGDNYTNYNHTDFDVDIYAFPQKCKNLLSLIVERCNSIVKHIGSKAKHNWNKSSVTNVTALNVVSHMAIA